MLLSSCDDSMFSSRCGILQFNLRLLPDDAFITLVAILCHKMVDCENHKGRPGSKTKAESDCAQRTPPAHGERRVRGVPRSRPAVSARHRCAQGALHRLHRALIRELACARN